MDYEKAYKEALERARKSHDKSNGFIKKEWIETIFPELKESEEERNERMWKLIKKYAHSNISDMVLDADHITRDQLESWLEKQCEQRPAPQWMIDFLDDDCRRNLGKTLDRDVYREMEGKLIAIKEFLETPQRGSTPEAPNEEKVDDDNADMAKPVFKVGDWIVSARGTARIISIGVTDSEFLLEYTDGDQESLSIEYVNSAYAKWTIQKAWDGDVLACGDKVSDCPFIFHNLTEELDLRSYCGVNTTHQFQVNNENGESWCCLDGVRPANKEQQDYLFKKMGEAGYMWDGHTKMLICSTDIKSK